MTYLDLVFWEGAKKNTTVPIFPKKYGAIFKKKIDIYINNYSPFKESK